jgi:hypothetical protein
MKKLILIAPIFAVGCAFDAAHMKGQEESRIQYHLYSDVEMQKQINVQSCFNTATTEMQTAICAMLAQSTGITSTFAGRPNQTVLAPTTGQIIGQTVQTVAPLALGTYGAVKAVEALAAHPKTVNPVIVEQPAPIIVEPFVVPAVEIPAAQ